MNMRSIHPNSLPSAHTDICAFRRDDGSAEWSLCLFSLPSTGSICDIINILHPEERAYYGTLQVERRQKSYLMGRYAAKQAVAALCEEKELRAISIEHGIFSQPVARNPYRQNIQVSITHCDDIGAAVAFPEAHPMGIDIEKIQERHRAVLEKQLTKHEKTLFTPIFSSYPEFLTALWTVKEGLSKILKTGLTTPFSIFEVAKIGMDGDRSLFEFRNFIQYRATTINLNGYVLAIVFPKKSELIIDQGNIKSMLAYTSGTTVG